MFLIAIPQNDIRLLNGDGCTVTINGQQAVLRREGDYLCYDDKRCKILDEHVSGDKVQFFAASHGDEDEPHLILRPDEIEVNKEVESCDHWWWLAVNGASCAASDIPIPDAVNVTPTPEQLIGFRTRKEQREAQQFLLKCSDKQSASVHEDDAATEDQAGRSRLHQTGGSRTSHSRANDVEFEGVWLSDRPLDIGQGADVKTVFLLEAPEEVLKPYEWVEDANFGWNQESKGLEPQHVRSGKSDP